MQYTFTQSQMRVKLKRIILYLNLLSAIVFYLIYISFNIVDSIVEIVKDEKNVLQGSERNHARDVFKFS